MFEPNMDEYLDEETEWVKRVLEGICAQWDTSSGKPGDLYDPSRGGPTFLNSSNPDQVKRNVLAGFKDVLLLPVTIVPRTVTFGVNAIVTGGSHAVNGLAMLNPQKWSGRTNEANEVVFEDKPEVAEVIQDLSEKMEAVEMDEKVEITPDATFTTADGEKKGDSAFDKLQLLVSLDIALELIHADREPLKRTETFANYPGKCGHRVRETIEEIFILMLKAAGDRHIAPGFRM